MNLLRHCGSVALVTVALATMLFVGAAPGGAASVSASTLSPPKTPDLKPGPDGFIRRWLVLEPIASNGLTDSAVQAAVKKEPFASQYAAVPRDEDRETVNGTELVWHAVDTTNYNLNLFHFATALKKNTSNVLFWVVTVVNAPARDARCAARNWLQCGIRLVGEWSGGDGDLWRSSDSHRRRRFEASNA